MISHFFIGPAATEGLPRSSFDTCLRRRRREGGQALVFALFTSVLVILALFTMYSMGGQAIEKIKLQNTADATAYSAAVAEARDYNFSAYTNRAMIANQVAVAQFVGMTSWFRNMSAFANNNDPTNVGRAVYQILLEFGGSPVASVYKSFLSGFGRVVGIFDEGGGGTTFTSAAVTVLDTFIKVYGATQMLYHYSTALTVAETLGAVDQIGSVMDDLLGVDWFTGFSSFAFPGSIVKQNDENANLTTGSLPYLVYHYYKWFKFTELKDPNTAGADGTEADRFAQVTMDSLDDFSRDRSTKPAWGFTFFYAPPLTYIDPTRFIPYQNGPLFLPVIHRGGTELKMTNTSNGGGTSGSTTSGPQGGLNCNNQTTSVNTSTSGSGSIAVDQYSDLAAFSSTSCEGDSGIVRVGNSAHPQGVYSFKKSASGTGGTWIDPSTLTGSTPSPAPPASGNRGPVGSKAKKSWTALDASSWAGIDILWITIPVIFIPIPLPIPFAPPWVPLSHGAAQSGTKLDPPTVLAADNNFGVGASDAYGGALDSWTTKISAELRQSKGAGNSLTKSTSIGGLTKYMDVTDTAADNLAGPPLVVEIEKPISEMKKSPGSDQFATENGAPQGKMRALSKAQVYFSRPTNDTVLLPGFQRTVGTASQTEVGSLYSPYWQARLLPNNFLEQYLSMEMHRFGI